jgi:hypothetical protein
MRLLQRKAGILPAAQPRRLVVCLCVCVCVCVRACVHVRVKPGQHAASAAQSWHSSCSSTSQVGCVCVCVCGMCQWVCMCVFACTCVCVFVRACARAFTDHILSCFQSFRDSSKESLAAATSFCRCSTALKRIAVALTLTLKATYDRVTIVFLSHLSVLE